MTALSLDADEVKENEELCYEWDFSPTKDCSPGTESRQNGEQPLAVWVLGFHWSLRESFAK